MTPNELMPYTLPALIVLIGASLYVTPRLTRHDLWFSVTVDGAFRDSVEGRGILRIYRVGIVLASVAALAIAIAGSISQAPLFATASIVAQLTGYTLAFLAGHRRTLAHASPASSIREAELKPRRGALPGGPLLQVGPFLVLAAASAWVAARWNDLPARFPTHWDFGGHADAWSTRTPAAVFGTSAVGLLLCGLLLLLSLGILTRSRRISASGPRGEAEQLFRFTTLCVLLGAEYVVALTSSWVTALPLVQNPAGPAVALTAMTLAFVVVTVVLLARIGQGGARLVAKADSGQPIGDRTADTNWRWGLLYVNRSDPALLVEKRFGLGYTLNFGNPWSLAMLAAFVVGPVVIALLSQAVG